jgi:hypothetical protein
MKIDFKITKDDYISFNLHHLENSKSQKSTFNILRYAVPIILSIPSTLQERGYLINRVYIGL